MCWYVVLSMLGVACPMRLALYLSGIFASSIAKGLCKYLGAAYVPARQETPKPAEPAQGDTLYRVQVGAFAVRANAEKMLDRLKKAGFTGFVVEGTR